MSQINFVPADLLAGVDQAASYARRLLVTAWLLSDGAEDVDGAFALAAVEFWRPLWATLQAVRVPTATVPTVLFELIELGLIEEIEDVPGGFDVALRKEDA